MPNKKQSNLIGDHPSAASIFGQWLECEDMENAGKQCHRALKESSSCNANDVVQWLTGRLIKHHYDDRSLERLKEKYGSIGFPQYALQNRRLPQADRTKKGNATEIMLLEYVEASTGKELTKILRLRYNPNVDQSMKGDDVLLVDLDNTSGESKIYLGEAKFRKTSDIASINKIVEALGKDKMPISWTYLIGTLTGIDPNLADELDKLILEDIKHRSGIVYVGLVLSDPNTATKVETVNLGDNSALVLISVSLEDPEEIILKSFTNAELLLTNPPTLGAQI